MSWPMDTSNLLRLRFLSLPDAFDVVLFEDEGSFGGAVNAPQLAYFFGGEGEHADGQFGKSRAEGEDDRFRLGAAVRPDRVKFPRRV